MRFFTIASALAAVALASPQQPQGYGESTTTSVAKQTVTRTVMRVVETVTATRNGTLSAYESTSTIGAPTPYASATGHMPGYSNGTTVLGTGAGAHPSASRTASAGAPMQTVNAAGKFGIETIGVAAIAGVVGLALF